jgi:hypothetical protein
MDVREFGGEFYWLRGAELIKVHIKAHIKPGLPWRFIVIWSVLGTGTLAGSEVLRAGC